MNKAAWAARWAGIKAKTKATKAVWLPPKPVKKPVKKTRTTVKNTVKKTTPKKRSL